VSEPVTVDPSAYAGWRASPLGALTERLEMDLVFELAGPLAGAAALDVGTGDGSYALAAASGGAIVTGVDADPAMLRAASLRAADRRVRLMLTAGRAEALPFADESFDVVLAVTVLCFVEDVTTALGEMARVLRPGGRVVVGELGRYNLWAASRRVRGWLGARTWRAARFWTGAALERQIAGAGLQITATRGAVYYPPSACLARLLAPLDRRLSRVGAPGAAFLAVSAVKPTDDCGVGAPRSAAAPGGLTR
jgi:2-polyprenyl-3-methyl-5-hydroxy-6-metoxy-1,4-benzoquinol methylase